MIPVIDLAPLLEGSSAGRQHVANEIGLACTTIGFFTIKNHGISPEIIKDILSTSRSFFDSPRDDKMKMAVMSSDYPYGYSGIMEETLSAGKALDGKDTSLTILPDLKVRILHLMFVKITINL